MYAPVGLKITGVNSELEDAPELVNEDPESKAWLVEIDCSGQQD